MENLEKKCKDCFWGWVVQQMEVTGFDFKKGGVQKVKVVKSKEKQIQRMCKGLSSYHEKIVNLNASCQNESQYKDKDS